MTTWKEVFAKAGIILISPSKNTIKTIKELVEPPKPSMFLTTDTEVFNREGFKIRIDNTVRAPYTFVRKMKDVATVKEWKTKRFSKLYPGVSCEVLMGDGSVASAKTRLSTVRKSYE